MVRVKDMETIDLIRFRNKTKREAYGEGLAISKVKLKKVRVCTRELVKRGKSGTDYWAIKYLSRALEEFEWEKECENRELHILSKGVI
jgi:hypothetical protein